MTSLSWQRLLGRRSSAAPAHGGEPTDGSSITTTSRSSSTTGTTSRSSTTSTTSDSHPFNILQPTSPVMEKIAEELGEEERAKMPEHIKALVARFPSDDDSAPGRWLSELEVSWVLHLNHGSEESNLDGGGASSRSGRLLYLAHSWIQALSEITKSISIYFGVGGGWCSSKDKPPAAASSSSEFIRLVQATLSKMLPFVDAIIAARTRREQVDEKLQALILLYDVLSTISEQILSSLSSSPLAVDNETRDLLSAELPIAKLDQATWNTIEEAKAGVMSSWWGTPRSSDIHPITRSFVSYIKVLWDNYRSVNRILHNAFLRGEFVPAIEYVSHLTNLTIEMFHSLEEKFTTTPESILDESRIFLFVINNFHYLLQQFPDFPMPQLPGKIEDYINSYIRVSWAPVLRCLHNPTTHCFTRRSPLQKFESKFHKTYTAQKLWKVPDPEMRKRMRKAIVEEVIPGFTEFFKDNTISNPTITPQMMKTMLEELFEG